MQNLIEKTNATDASGNIVFGDIGVHIQQEVFDCSFHHFLHLFICKLLAEEIKIYNDIFYV